MVWSDDYNGLNGSVPATTVAAGINIATLGRGATMAYAGGSTRTYNSSVPAGETAASPTNGSNTYYDVTLSVAAGKYLNLSKLKARIRTGSAKSANAYKWYYSLNSGNSWAEVATGATLIGLTAAEGDDQPEVDLSAVAALKNITGQTVYFRLYAWGAASDAIGAEKYFGIGKSGNGFVRSVLTFTGWVTDSVLPVKLLSFTAKPEGRAVKLNWATAAEQDNDRFEIIRTDENGHSLTIANVKGTNNAAGSNYSFNDYSASAGVNYYLLRQYDKNGNFEDLKIIAANLSPVADNLTAHSKEGSVTIAATALTAGKATITVTNASGQQILTKQVWQQSGQNQFTFGLPNVKGVYVLSLQSASGVKRLKFYN
ncbi:hypothetical protein MASR2M52_16200 [Pedobacter sp.]